MNILVEGSTDEVIVKKILSYLDIPIGPVYGKGGVETLLVNLPKYNKAAHFSPWLVVLDLDRARCAPTFIDSILPYPPAPHLLLRIAVREIEAWLLGDAETLARYLSISKTLFPKDPDAESDPKISLVNLARKSRVAAIKNDMVPRQTKGAGKVGPGYPSRIIDYARNHWRPDVAAQRSDSLRRCLDRLRAYRDVHA